MSTISEVTRITSIYDQYRHSSIQAQWDTKNKGNQSIIAERQGLTERLLDLHGFFPLSEHRILDIGSGNGTTLAGFLDWNAQPHNLYGIDLLPDRVAEAKEAFPELHFQQANAEELDFADATFDLMLLFTVFTSILDDGMAHNVAAEVQRVLKPGGAVIWYDFRYNNPRNPHVRGMSKSMIQRLFPLFDLQLCTITLLPPLARRLGLFTPILYPLLSRIPFLRTHYLGLLVKPC